MNTETVIETNEQGTARVIREMDGTYAVQRVLDGRWFTVVRDPKPFYADNRNNETPEQSALLAPRYFTAV